MRRLPHDLAAIQNEVNSKGDRLRVRVMRKKAGGGLDAVAIFEDAKIEHIITPETWLGTLAGGGSYFLGIFHMDEPAKQIGGMIEHGVDGPLGSPNWNVINSVAWSGPTSLFWPDPKAPLATPTNGKDQHVGSRTPRRFGEETTSDNPLLAGLERNSQRERELIEKKAQLDLDVLRRQMEDERRQLEARLVDLTSKISSQKSDPLESIKGLAGPIMQGVQMIFTSFQAARDEQNKRFEKLIETMMAMVNKKEDPDTREKQLFATMTDSVGKMASTTMSLLASAAELREATAPENAGPTVSEIVMELAKSFGKFAESTTARQAQLPAGQPGQQGQRPPPNPTPQTPAKPIVVRTPESSLDRLELMVKQRVIPEEIAVAFFEEFDANAAFAKLVTEVPDSDTTQKALISIFGPRLTSWYQSNPNDHGAYLQQIGEAIDALAIKSGRMATPPQAGAQA